MWATSTSSLMASWCVFSTYSRLRAELWPSHRPSAGGCNRRRSPHVRCAGGSGAGTGQHSSSPDEAHLPQGRPCCANVHPCPRPAGRGLVEVLYQANELTRSVPGHRCFAGFQLRAHQHRLGRCCVVTQCVRGKPASSPNVISVVASCRASMLGRLARCGAGAAFVGLVCAVPLGQKRSTHPSPSGSARAAHVGQPFAASGMRACVSRPCVWSWA